MKEVREIYDKVFKEKAVQFIYENISIRTRQRVRITRPQLYKWRKEFEEFGEGSFHGKGNLKLTTE